MLGCCDGALASRCSNWNTTIARQRFEALARALDAGHKGQHAEFLKHPTTPGGDREWVGNSCLRDAMRACRSVMLRIYKVELSAYQSHMVEKHIFLNWHLNQSGLTPLLWTLAWASMIGERLSEPLAHTQESSHMLRDQPPGNSRMQGHHQDESRKPRWHRSPSVPRVIPSVRPQLRAQGYRRVPSAPVRKSRIIGALLKPLLVQFRQKHVYNMISGVKNNA